MNSFPRPPTRVILTPLDAEIAARDWLAFLGFADARVTVTGPDEGIDVVSLDVVAQVKAVGHPVGRPVVQQIFGVASLAKKQALLFTIEGVTRQAREWADRAEVGLFRLNRSGGVVAENAAAEVLLDAAEGLVLGWSAVRAELEQYLSEGTAAEISSIFELSNGQRGYWMVRHDGAEVVEVSLDVAGSRIGDAGSIAEAVKTVLVGVRSLGASFQDCRPFLAVNGERRRFFPRLSYEAPESEAQHGSSEPTVQWTEPKRLRVTASDLYQALSGQRCDRRIYLDHHGVEPGEPSSLSEMMRDLGTSHEVDALRALGQSFDLGAGTIEERSSRTAAAIDRGEQTLYQPVFLVRREVGSHDCEFVGAPDFMLLTPGGWVIRDTKVAQRVNAADRPDIAAQLQFYGWLFEQSGDERLSHLEVLNGAGDLQRFEHEGWSAIEDVIERIVRMKTASAEPACRTRTAHSSCAYFDRCWGQAVEQNDVSTVPGVTKGLVSAFNSSGIRTLEGLLDQHDQATLGEVEIAVGKRTQRVGARAERIIRSTESLTTGKPIWFAVPELPPQEHVVLFDLEGVPAIGRDEGLIYLWGTEVSGPSPTDYVPVFAEPGAGGASGWFAFLDHAGELFEHYGSDLPFVHWAPYERTQIRQHIERFGDPQGIAAQVLNNLFDLLKTTKKSVTLPLYSYSLKHIEKYIGFERSQTEFGGAWSIVVWQQAVAAVDPVERSRLLAQLAVYNQEDCAATGAVLHWLRLVQPHRGHD